MKKLVITEKQAEQFQSMWRALKLITAYQTPPVLRKSCKGDFGLSYEEALEYAYDNMKQVAIHCLKGIRPLPASKEHEK